MNDDQSMLAQPLLSPLMRQASRKFRKEDLLAMAEPIRFDWENHWLKGRTPFPPE